MKTVSQMFDEYLEIVNLKKEEMPEPHLREVRRAFYGACGQFIVALSTEFMKGNSINVTDLDQEIEYFWLSEAERYES
jgi:hypothetical protein